MVYIPPVFAVVDPRFTTSPEVWLEFVFVVALPPGEPLSSLFTDSLVILLDPYFLTIFNVSVGY